MTIQEIQRLRNERPFKPFRVLTADGDKYDVWHPEVMGQTPSGRIITIGLEDDSTVSIDLLLVVGIQKGIKRLRTNGRQRRR